MTLALHLFFYACGALAVYAIGCDLWCHRLTILSIITGKDLDQ